MHYPVDMLLIRMPACILLPHRDLVCSPIDPALPLTGIIPCGERPTIVRMMILTHHADHNGCLLFSPWVPGTDNSIICHMCCIEVVSA